MFYSVVSSLISLSYTYTFSRASKNEYSMIWERYFVTLFIPEEINPSLDQGPRSTSSPLITKYSILTGGRLSFETALSPFMRSKAAAEPDDYAAINGWSTM